MSRTYALVCHECRVQLWIGQGWPDRKQYIYTTPENLALLQTFFFGHQQHRLEFGDDEYMDIDFYEDVKGNDDNDFPGKVGAKA